MQGASGIERPRDDDAHRAKRGGRSGGVLEFWVPGLLCVITAGLMVMSVWRDGGYFADDVLAIATWTLVACAVALVVTASRWRPTLRTLVVLGGIVGLAAWTGLSSAWSPDPAGASLAAQRDVGYAAFVLLAALAVGNGRHSALLLRLTVLVLVGVCGVALISRLRPAAFNVDPDLLHVAQGRLAFPVGYWNGLGAVAAMAIMGTLGLAADAREHPVVRALCASGGVIAVFVLYLTISRGAGLALVGALAVVFALSQRRLRLSVSAALMLAAGAAGVGVLQAHRVLVDQPGTLEEQAKAGRTVFAALLVLVVGAGLTQAALARVPFLNKDRPWRTRHGRTARAGAVAGLVVPAVMVVAALAAVYATSSDTLEGQAANGTTGLRSFVERQYDAFMDTSKPPPIGTERLSTASSSRSDAYRVAIDGFQAHPLQGDGAAGYHVRWYRERDVYEDFRNAHSLELETASELGIVGVALLLAFLAPFIRSLQGLRKASGGLTRSQAASAGGVFVVWLIHSALDWDWQLSCVTLPALACGIATLVQGQRPSTGQSGMIAGRPTVRGI